MIIRLSSILSKTLPALTIFSFLIMNFFLLHGDYPSPDLALIAMIYWAIYRPDLTRIYLIVTMGIIIDVMQGQDAWIHSFMMIAVNLMATSQFKFFYRKPFYLIWAGVSLIIFAYYITFLLYGIIFLKADLQLFSALSTLLLTCLLIPVVFRLMVFLHGLMHERV